MVPISATLPSVQLDDQGVSNRRTIYAAGGVPIDARFLGETQHADKFSGAGRHRNSHFAGIPTG
jgi:hypothetical protein